MSSDPRGRVEVNSFEVGLTLSPLVLPFSLLLSNSRLTAARSLRVRKICSYVRPLFLSLPPPSSPTSNSPSRLSQLTDLRPTPSRPSSFQSRLPLPNPRRNPSPFLRQPPRSRFRRFLSSFRFLTHPSSQTERLHRPDEETRGDHRAGL